MAKDSDGENFRQQLTDTFQNAGLKFERYNGDNDQLWFSPYTGRVVYVPLKVSKTDYDRLIGLAGIKPA